jgi:ABC-2 type transport system ATP-binding protein
MLRLKNISKNFGDKEVLRNINFEIDKNCVVGLLGPNGAGKTTLMRVIVGFYKANKGEIFWDKKLIDTKDENYRSKVGYLPENNPLYQNMTTIEYLKLIANLKGIEKEKTKKEIEKIIIECGLKNILIQKIETLSKGYKQRVGLAAALIGDPKILILDEPTSGLDPNQIIEIRSLIKKMAKNKTILLSTHILSEAKEICKNLLIIKQGKIVLNEETKKIKNLEKKFVQLTS